MGRKKKNIVKPQVEDEVFVDIIEEGDFKENFIDKYQNYLLIGVAAILIIIAGFYRWSRLTWPFLYGEMSQRLAEYSIGNQL